MPTQQGPSATSENPSAQGETADGTVYPRPKPGVAERNGSSGRDREEATLDVSAFDVVERIRRVVLDDIVSRDKLLLADAVYGRIEERANARNKEELHSLIGAEFSNRVKNLVAMVTVILAILAFVGFTVVRDAMTSEARAAAKTEAEEQVKRQVTVIQRQIDLFESSVKASIDSLGQKERQVQMSATEAVFTVSRKASDVMAESKATIDEGTKATLLEFGQATKKEKEYAIEEIRKAKIDAMTEINKVFDRRSKQDDVPDAPGKRAQPSTTGAAEEHVEPEEPEIDDAFLTISIFRRYDFSAMLRLAEKFVRRGNHTQARNILDAVLVNPGHFTAADRLDVVRLVTSQAVPSEERYNAASEALVSAAKSQDQEMARIADESLKKNIRTRVYNNDWEDFVRAAVQGKHGDELAEEFIRVTGLTTRGKANMLLLGKLGQVRPELLTPVEGELLDEVFSTGFIDRSTDYNAAWLVAKALTTEPVNDRERVQSTLQELSRFVLSDEDKDNDPFGLASLIAGFSADGK